jgi:hypothetical protein
MPKQCAPNLAAERAALFQALGRRPDLRPMKAQRISPEGRLSGGSSEVSPPALFRYSPAPVPG